MVFPIGLNTISDWERTASFQPVFGLVDFLAVAIEPKLACSRKNRLRALSSMAKARKINQLNKGFEDFIKGEYGI